MREKTEVTKKEWLQTSERTPYKSCMHSAAAAPLPDYRTTIRFAVSVESATSGTLGPCTMGIRRNLPRNTVTKSVVDAYYVPPGRYPTTLPRFTCALMREQIICYGIYAKIFFRIKNFSKRLILVLHITPGRSIMYNRPSQKF